jgi:hypothetical protein
MDPFHDNEPVHGGGEGLVGSHGCAVYNIALSEKMFRHVVLQSHVEHKLSVCLLLLSQ